MPILKQESDLFPEDLFHSEDLLSRPGFDWWCVYTISRQEKKLMRQLRKLKVSHYGPVIPKRYRSPNGRLRTSWIPLFPNYIFLFADDQSRIRALTTNCISKCDKVEEPQQLLADLKRIQTVIQSGIPLTPEGKLKPGNQVRVKSGHFAGFEGTVIRREGKTRFSISIQYLSQGVSVEMDEGLLEAL